MALTNTEFNPADLLSFMNSATNNIQEAMNSVKSKKKVNHRRFISKNVSKPARKRLQSASNKPKTVIPTKLDNSAASKGENRQLRSDSFVSQPTCTMAIDADVSYVLNEWGSLDQPEAAPPRDNNYAWQVPLEQQVTLAEYPYSPFSTYSNCSGSEDWLDSAYSSPSCSSNAYMAPPQTDIYELVQLEIPYQACIPDQGLPVTPTLYQVLDSFDYPV